MIFLQMNDGSNGAILASFLRLGALMNTQSTGEIRYVHLNTVFYQDFKHHREILKDENRQYLHLVTQYKGNTFVIPFRSGMNHKYGFKFRDQENKGLDFTKSVILNDPQKYMILSQKNIPQYQHDLIIKNAVLIERQFCRYIDDYCGAVQKNDANALRRIAYFSSLQYFHTELGL